MTRLRHYDDPGVIRFVTFSCYQRRPFLEEDVTKLIFIDQLKKAKILHGFKLHGYVVMPDHVHLVLLPRDDTKMGLLIREIKSKTARRFFSRYGSDQPKGEKKMWERRCYDHNCRNLESVKEKINYCHMNPVRKGLVTTPEEYQWSSYCYLIGIAKTPIDIDYVDI